MTQISPLTAARAVAAQRPDGTPQATIPGAGTSNARVSTIFSAEPRKAVKDMSVKERFATLTKRFIPSKAKGLDVSFQFKLSGKGGGDWYVKIKDGKVTVKEGTGPKPTATLKAKASDYLKIANGEMSKTWAFLRGKVKVDGDKDALGKFDSYFKS